jgi:hypothetical protein
VADATSVRTSWARGSGSTIGSAEPEPYLVFFGVDVIEGEAGDRSGSLGVEKNEQPGDAVGGVDAAPWSSRQACCQRISGSKLPAGPSHSLAAKSRSVSFCPLARRTKCGASRRCLESPLGSHVSWSACCAVARVRPWLASESSRAIAALTCCRTSTWAP